VRSDRAIRRHWELVCCAFCFCWWAHGRDLLAAAPWLLQQTDATTDTLVVRKKIRPSVSWPVALRQVRSWLQPWVLLTLWWRDWTEQPPPPALLDWLWNGHGIPYYDTSEPLSTNYR
jgi:hypothetical protein